MTAALETVEHETETPISASVIWMHGLGADGHDFEPLVPELAEDGLGLRFVFPHAPIRPVTLNQGLRMRAWFDVHGLDRRSRQDEAGIRACAKSIAALVLRENERGVPSRRIVLAGFSQGGAMALHTGLRHRERLAGILALSTCLPLDDTLEREAAEENRKTPIFMAHGTADPLVPISLGEGSRDQLATLGYPVAWKSYRMPHSVSAEEIADIRAWIGGILSPGAGSQ